MLCLAKNSLIHLLDTALLRCSSQVLETIYEATSDDLHVTVL